MIDFAASTLTFGGLTFGTKVLPYKESQIFKIITELDYFPLEIKAKVNEFDDNPKKLTDFFLQLYKEMKPHLQNLQSARQEALKRLLPRVGTSTKKRKFLGGKRKYRKTRKE